MKKIFTWAYYFCIIFLGLLFFTAGMGKLFANHQFFGLMGPVWLEERLAQYDLGLFARFVAYSQVLIGFFLLSFRFRTLGAVMLMPMLLNIFFITVSQNWRGTPYVVAVFFLQNLYVLWHDRAVLLPLLTGETNQTHYQPLRTWQGNAVWLIGLGFVISSISISFYTLPTAWILALLGILLGIFSKKWDKKNEANLGSV